jgi:hypothetical protein
MAPSTDIERVVEFRKKLATFVEYAPRDLFNPHLGGRVVDKRDQEWLFQRYGLIHRAIAPYGPVQLRKSGVVVSQDVVSDAIGSPDHPAYADIALLALQHVDYALGRLVADVEETAAQARARSAENLYRLTSPVYWLGRSLGVVRWLAGTTRGRLATLIGAVFLAVIGGIVSGMAQAWFQQFTSQH